MAIPVLPPSAPFTPEQRAYLNGFFAGVFGMEGNPAHQQGVAVPPSPALNGIHLNGASPASAPLNGADLNGSSPNHSEAEADESTPWHDPALGLDERMELAQGRPIRLKLMAAMAQLDCGQCGYVCKSYAEAIADGSEKSLRKCIPGGKETATQLKELMASS